MPSFKSFAAFGAEVEKLRKELEGAEKRRITRDMAEQAQKIAERAASGDLGGDPKFSRWKPELDTQIKPTRGNGHLLAPTKTGAGPWTVAQFGRHADGGVGRFQGPSLNMRTGRTTRTKTGALTNRTRTTGVRWNGVTKGKGTADKAIAAMERELPKLAENGVRRVLRKHFDVT
jgi:hypothetical protein